MKGKALRRAIATDDAIRVNADIVAITDKTELITPEYARELLSRNRSNRPINWRTVEKYAETMRNGQWSLTPQGIIIDSAGNISTGQKRLWAVIYSGVSVYMRVSRGSSPNVAKLIDRGDPQSARDLASRDTERKHSPTESSIARAVLALRGNLRPSKDELAEIIVLKSGITMALLAETAGTKKTRAVLMLLAAIAEVSQDADRARSLTMRLPQFVDQLEDGLKPESPQTCWGRGAAFVLAMEQARKLVNAVGR